MEIALSVGIDTALITFTLALAAFGLAIIYGLIGVINMGHGAMLTLGAYFTWAGIDIGIPFVLSVIIAGILVGIIGTLLEHFIIRHYYDSPFDTLLLTWAFFLVTTELIKIFFGSDFRTVTNPYPGFIDIGFYKIPTYRTSISILTAIFITATGFVFLKTTTGIKIRAMIQNQEVASILGLNISLTYKMVFGFGCFMAGLAGGLVAPMVSVSPYMGDMYLVRSFFVVIVGGIGQILSGTIAGSFVIGGLETIVALFSDQVIAQVAVFLFAIIILRLRPQGIYSEK
ncbi:uncharacterized protein METZ01_LOCUS153094 [marine metagenome]|uniref:Uncharacterized protein n=1 Tax=marine metagenome TaxID=408172 RepID=A0A382AFA0_9ZZZZ